MTEDQQNEEYKKSIRIARSVSVGNMQAYKDEILAEQEERNKKNQRFRSKKYRKGKKPKTKNKKRKYNRMPKSLSTKNTPKVNEPRYAPYSAKQGSSTKGHKHNISEPRARQSRLNRTIATSPTFKFDTHLSKSIPPKLIQGDESRTFSSDSDDSTFDRLVSPPEIETANALILKPYPPKRKVNARRRRSKTAQSSQDAIINALKFPYQRHSAQKYPNRLVTQPSRDCPTSPSIPEELDDDDYITDIIPMRITSSRQKHRIHSRHPYDSDSSSSTSTDHACEMAKPIKLAMIKRPSLSDTNTPTSPALTSAARSCNNLVSLSRKSIFNHNKSKFQKRKRNFLKAQSAGDEGDIDDDDDDDDHVMFVRLLVRFG